MHSLLIFIFFFPNTDSRKWATWDLTLQTGSSVTIPCYYNIKYSQHKKYWCYDHGSRYNYCTIQAYANKTEGKVTVTDNPAESLFTVTMRDLKEANTGMYWCAVEITGFDVTEDIYITVKPEPDVSVLESRVRGEEGGNVTIQCLYRASYKNTQKQWCRSKAKQCYSVGKTSTSQNSSVQVSDDGRSSFRVQMTGLKKSDAGWYWCSAGDLEVPVHLNVTDPPAVSTTVTVTTPCHTTPKSVTQNRAAASVTADFSTAEIVLTQDVNITQSQDSKQGLSRIFLPLVALLMSVCLILIISIFMLRKKHKGKNLQDRERSNDNASESELSYIPVHFKPRMKKSGKRTLQQFTSTSEEPVTYSTVAKRSPIATDDEIIYSSVVR